MAKGSWSVGRLRSNVASMSARILMVLSPKNLGTSRLNIAK
jgi:hypothetical protein